MYRKIAIASLVAAICCSAFGQAVQQRVSATQKGSVLIFPKIEVRWADDGTLIQDTFVDIANDNTIGVHLVMYYVNELCETIYNDIDLTKNEPAWWAASTGIGSKAVAPFFGFDQAYDDPDGSTDLVIRGYLVVIAANELNQQINFNHLYGQATLVNYEEGDAWEYNAYAFRALQGNTGQTFGEPGVIPLNGTSYDYAFDFLLLDYFASGSAAFSGAGVVVEHETDLTLMIVDQDLRQETEGPYVTKAFFRIWNEDESSFTNEFCLIKWDQSLISKWGGAFLRNNLQTDKGRARIDGIASELCNTVDDENNPVLTSDNFPLLGVQAKILTFDGTTCAKAGGELAGSGYQATDILYDVLTEPPPEKALAPTPMAPAQGMRR